MTDIRGNAQCTRNIRTVDLQGTDSHKEFEVDTKNVGWKHRGAVRSDRLLQL